MSSSKEDTSQKLGITPNHATFPTKTNALYISEIYGSSSQGGILTLSGVGPGEPGGNVNMNPQGGKMGIGTDNPTNSLSVVGDSDFTGNLTIKGNCQIGGDLSVTGELDLSSIKNSFWINDQPIYLRTKSTTDQNHGIGYSYNGGDTNNNIDGPVVFGYAGGALSINKGGKVKHILKWDYPGNDFTGTASVIIDGHLGFTGNGEFSGALKIDGNVGIGTEPDKNFQLSVKGNSQIEGDLSITGELDLSSIKNSFWVNDQPIYLRTKSTTDKNHGIGHGYNGGDNSNNIDGPVVFGYAGGALSINKGGKVKHILKWDYPGNDFTGTASVIIDGHLDFTGNGEFSGDLKIDGNVGIGTEPDKNFQLSVKGNSQIDGDLSITGELDLSSIKNSFWANDNSIYLRTKSTTDQNHGIAYNKDIDGPVVFGYSGGALSTTGSGKLQHILKWDSNGVYFQGTGGRTRIAQLSVSDGTISSSNIFSDQYLYYELIFNNVTFSDRNNDTKLRAQFFDDNDSFLGENGNKNYYVNLYGNDNSNNCPESHIDYFFHLWPDNRAMPSEGFGIFGIMTIFTPRYDGPKCFNAHFYAPYTCDSTSTCQVWVGGSYYDKNTPSNTPKLKGISFFCGSSKDRSIDISKATITGGTIDVYGWN